MYIPLVYWITGGEVKDADKIFCFTVPNKQTIDYS